jgi:hypothetical protein
VLHIPKWVSNNTAADANLLYWTIDSIFPFSVTPPMPRRNGVCWQHPLSLISLSSLKRDCASEPQAVATSSVSGKDPSEGDQLGCGTVAEAPAAPVEWLQCRGCGTLVPAASHSSSSWRMEDMLNLSHPN